jgi:glutathione S-transferase
VNSAYLDPNFNTHFAFLESQLESAPGGGPYLCGPKLTGADMLMSYPLEAGLSRSPLKDKYPRLVKYTELLTNEPGYKKAVDKIVEIEGKFEASL